MWSLNNLSYIEILDILRLLHNDKLQYAAYTEPNHQLRKYLPFVDQIPLQQRFLMGYAHAINNIDPTLYKTQLIILGR